MFRKLVMPLLLAAVLLSACNAAVALPAELKFTDGLGREVKLSGPAQKIISLAPSNTEILFAVGAGKQVVGREEYSDYPAEVQSIPSVGGMGKYNFEQMVALKPDLILLAEINSPEMVGQLEDLGLTVFYLSNPKTLEDMYANLQTVASLTGHEKETDTLIESLKKRVSAVDEKVKLATAQPVVFYELDATNPATPFTAGPGTFVDLLIQRAGGVNVVSKAGITDPYPQLSSEQLVSSDPDVIILGDSMWGVTAEAVGQRPGWENLKAVTGAQVYPFDDNTVSRPGPRLVDGLEQMAKLLHPELFK